MCTTIQRKDVAFSRPNSQCENGSSVRRREGSAVQSVALERQRYLQGFDFSCSSPWSRAKQLLRWWSLFRGVRCCAEAPARLCAETHVTSRRPRQHTPPHLLKAAVFISHWHCGAARRCHAARISVRALHRRPRCLRAQQTRQLETLQIGRSDMSSARSTGCKYSSRSNTCPASYSGSDYASSSFRAIALSLRSKGKMSPAFNATFTVARTWSWHAYTSLL